MKKNKVFPILLAGLIGLSSRAYANDKYDIYLNNKAYTSKSVIEEDGLVYLPLRDIVELLNYKVDWDHKGKIIKIKNNQEDIEILLNSSEIIKNQEVYSLKGKNILKGENTYSPIDLFGKHMNVVGSYKDKTKDIHIRNLKENKINSDDPEFTEIAKKIDNYLRANVEAKNFHGSVLSVKNNSSIINQGYSFSNLEKSLDNKTQTKFSIGSISKQFTAVGILQLYEKNLIGLNDTVDKYLTNIKDGDKITIHQLLSHTSGLINYTDQVEFYSLKDDDKLYDEIIAIINKAELGFKPGSKYQYSNSNYLLLANIIEKISGLSYEDYMNENIFKPLDMKDTGINYGKNNESSDATGYIGYLDVEVMDDEFLQKALKGAGNIYSTTEDLYKWSNALDKNILISKKTRDELLYGKHVSIGGNSKAFYGYGFMILEGEKGDVYMHDGQTFGFSSLIVKYPEEDLVNIILVNNRLYDVMTIESDIYKMINLEEVKNPEPIKPVKLDEDDLKKFLGKYVITEDLFIEIKMIDKELVAELTGQAPYRIIYTGDNQFLLRAVDAKIEFIPDEKGELNKLLFKQLGLEYVGIKGDQIKDSKESIGKIDKKKYIGDYILDLGVKLSVSEENNKLYAQVEGQNKIELKYDKDDKFNYLGINIQLEFLNDTNNLMQGIRLYQAGQVFEGKRLK